MKMPTIKTPAAAPYIAAGGQWEITLLVKASITEPFSQTRWGSCRQRPLWSPLESEPTMFFAGVSLSPSTSDLPGSAALQSIADGIASWALIGALVALLLGAVLWAIGSHTQNMHQSAQGRRAVLTSIAAAILIGAAPELINFFFNTGLSVK